MDGKSIVRTVTREDGVSVSLFDGSEEQFKVTFEKVNVLSNGWLECINPDGSDPSEVDYYPPHRVVGVFGNTSE